jgi:predicted nucleic acid-binding Zn ribbon protein
MGYADKKEINLFGDKSIREEAYRKKILQLEKEVSRIEVLARGQDENIKVSPENQPKNLNNLYYESLMSFDARLKKEQEFFEKRATEITEKLESKAQRLIHEIERRYHRKAIKLFFLVFVLVAVFIVVLNYPRTRGLFDISKSVDSSSLLDRTGRVRSALSSQTRYYHQYNINDIRFSGNTYTIDIELNNLPANTWYLRDIAQDVVRVYNRFSGYAPGEISFLYNGKLYAKASLSGSSGRPYIRYLY